MDFHLVIREYIPCPDGFACATQDEKVLLMSRPCLGVGVYNLVKGRGLSKVAQVDMASSACTM